MCLGVSLCGLPGLSEKLRLPLACVLPGLISGLSQRFNGTTIEAVKAVQLTPPDMVNRQHFKVASVCWQVVLTYSSHCLKDGHDKE